ncbi:MAG: translation initiation factor IF-1 [Verrucomicrobiota bacterium]
MPGEDAIKIVGTVSEALPNTLFVVTLSNGHRVMAHLAGNMKSRAAEISPGDKVNLKMSPFDLSKGVIVLREI